MSNTNNSFDTSIGLEYKDNPNWTDSRRIANYLQYHTATCTMLCKALGIEQKLHAGGSENFKRKAFYLNYTRAFANTQMRKQPI